MTLDPGPVYTQKQLEDEIDWRLHGTVLAPAVGRVP